MCGGGRGLVGVGVWWVWAVWAGVGGCGVGVGGWGRGGGESVGGCGVGVGGWGRGGGESVGGRAGRRRMGVAGDGQAVVYFIPAGLFALKQGSRRVVCFLVFLLGLFEKMFLFFAGQSHLSVGRACFFGWTFCARAVLEHSRLLGFRVGF